MVSCGAAWKADTQDQVLGLGSPSVDDLMARSIRAACDGQAGVAPCHRTYSNHRGPSMDSPKYSEQARIYKAQQYARQPWRPFKVVFRPTPEESPASVHEAERLQAALITADIELSRIIHKVKLEDRRG